MCATKPRFGCDVAVATVLIAGLIGLIWTLAEFGFTDMSRELLFAIWISVPVSGAGCGIGALLLILRAVQYAPASIRCTETEPDVV